MKKILSLVLFLSFTTIFYSELNAQFVDIGSGTTVNGTTTASPINIFYRSRHYQVVYTAAELTASGALPGDIITELGWYVTGIPVNDLPNYTLKLKHTSAPDASIYDGLGLTTVVTVPLHTPTAGGYDMTTFSTNFIWNGTSNLLVDVCFDQVNPTYNASGQVRTFAGSARHVQSDGSSQCGVATNSDLSERAQVRLVMSGGTPPPCVPPSGLNTSLLTATSTDVNWSAGGGVVFMMEYGTPGFSPGTGAALGSTLGTSTTESITGLTAATAYEFYVIALCTSGDTLLPVGPFSFVTPCATYTAPYYQDFDANLSTPICWDNVLAGEAWEFDPSGSFGPGYGVAGAVDHTTGAGNYAWIDASGGIGANQLISPPIDFSALSQGIVGCWILSNNIDNGAQNVLSIEAYDGAAWIPLTTYSGNDASWVRIYANIPSSIPTTTIFRLVQIESTTGLGNAYNNDLLIDDFFVEEGPPCIAPSLLTSSAVTATSVDLSWAPGGGIFYMMEYGLPGFVPGTGAELGSTSGTNTLESITGLSPASGYEFYVTAICPTGDTLSPIGPISFITACATLTAPYYQNFDFNLSTPICWDNVVGGEEWEFNASGAGGPGYGVAGAVDHTTGTGNYAWIDASGGIGTNELVTPPIDFSGLTQGIVGCWILSNNIDNGAQNVLSIEAFDGTAWIPLTTYSGNNAAWLRVYATIPATIPTTTIFRLVQIESTTGVGNAFNNDLLIDDFFVEEEPTCLNSINLSDSILSPTTVELSWNAVGSATNWIIEYGPTGFIPGTGAGTLVNTSSNPIILTVPSGADFDWYVQDSCGPADLSWYSYVNNFRMPGEVYCDSTNNFTYCHPDESIETFTYQSENGSSQLHFVFNSGILGNGVDFIIYDGPDNTFPILYSTSAFVGADLTGLEFTSSSSIVTFDWNSQFANVCNTPLDFDVNCCIETSSMQNIFICVDSTYMLADSVVVSNPGSYSAVIPNSLGCDSVISYNVFELPDTVNVSENLCNGDVYVFADGTSTSTAAVYQTTVSNQNGCDSTINYTINLLMPSFSSINANICQGDVYVMPDGATVSGSGSYIATINNAVGCDSVITVNLNVFLPSSSTENVSICDGETHELPDGVVVSTSGTYTSVVTDLNNCNLHTITTIVTLSVATSSDIVVELCGDDTYSLLNGDVVDESGEYNVIINNAAGCDSLVTVYISKCNAIDDLNGEGILNIYPNPATTLLNVVLNDLVINNDVELKIIDALGQTIYKAKELNNNELKINVEDFSAGMYFIVLSDNESSSLHKFMISK